MIYLGKHQLELDEQHASSVEYSPSTSSEGRQNSTHAGKSSGALPGSNLGHGLGEARDGEQKDGSGVSDYLTLLDHMTPPLAGTSTAVMKDCTLLHRLATRFLDLATPYQTMLLAKKITTNHPVLVFARQGGPRGYRDCSK